MNNPEKLQNKVHKTKKNKTKIQQCGGHQYTQTNTNNVNKTRALIQTTGGKDEPNIVYMQKSYRTPQRGNQNVKTDNM